MAQAVRPTAPPRVPLSHGVFSQGTCPASAKRAARRTLLSAASAATSSTLACRARQAAPAGSSPTSARPALRAMPSRCSALSIAVTCLHLRLQGVVHPVGHGGGEGPLQGPGLPRLLQALRIGAHVGPPARLLPLEVQGDLPLRALHHPDELLLGLHLPAPQALTHGDLFGHLRNLLFWVLRDGRADTQVGPYDRADTALVGAHLRVRPLSGLFLGFALR